MWYEDVRVWIAIAGSLGSITTVMSFVNNWYQRHSKEKLDEIVKKLQEVFLTKAEFNHFEEENTKDHHLLHKRLDKVWMAVFMQPATGVIGEHEKIVSTDDTE